MENKDIYDLELHEPVIINGVQITRVPGGWIYKYSSGVQFVEMNMEFDTKSRKSFPDEIVKYVEGYFGLPVPIIKTKSRGGNYPIAKQIICKLLKKFTSLSNIVIAEKVNVKTGGSVNNSIIRLNDLIYTDPIIKSQYNYIKDQLNL